MNDELPKQIARECVRILLIFSSSELGGAERSLTRMTLLHHENIQYTLASLDGPGAWSDWYRELGGHPFLFGSPRGTLDDSNHSELIKGHSSRNHELRQAQRGRMKIVQRYLGENGRHGHFNLKALWRMLALVRQSGFNAIYVIGLRASFWLRVLKPFLCGARLVHGIRWNPNSGSRLDRTFRLIERCLGWLVDLYVCNSQVAALTLECRAGVSSKKIRVIHNGLANLSPLPTKPLAERPLHVTVLANLNWRKGHIEFLNVVASIAKRLPQTHFFFVGRDDMAGRVATEIERRGLAGTVTLTGYQADIAPWLAETRLMVLPSLWGEGCPTSILEGQAHGLPVIAYAIDGIPELIADGIDGLLVPPGDIESFSSAILRLLEDPALAQRMGDAGRTKVERNFTLARCASLHTAIFSELAATSETGHS
ncbi:MAG: glycosyltransferase family 4 protein [Azoarcus sp.]|jgi:glycosyltransferase involved in cell wall biosynthesis|nr:glycosyltransferase family 4 protein [Azoarcus sp.]